MASSSNFSFHNFSIELKKVLHSIGSGWGDVLEDMTKIEVVPLKGALTNEVYQLNWPTKSGGAHRKLLLRIYGRGVDVFFNRYDEIRTFECMSHHGQGPRLLGRFSGGRIEEFIHARTLSAADLRDPEISALIAAKMREFHNLVVPGPRIVLLWHRIRNWLGVAINVCSPQDATRFTLYILEDEINVVERELSKINQAIGFCHNDLQYGNIMMDEETRSLTLIFYRICEYAGFCPVELAFSLDYEYASFNPVAYDLANHFCEMAANYHSETPHVLDYTAYPGLEERQNFVRAYLNSSGPNPSEAEVGRLVDAAEKYTLANHLFWGLWGVISAYVNNIHFDYRAYAAQRLEQYWLRKPLLNLH